MTPTPETLAAYLHAGQRDRVGLPYVGHCQRVAEGLPGDADDDMRWAAFLHDALEQGTLADGSPCTLEWLARWVPAGALDLVVELTRNREAETYLSYVARLSRRAAVIKRVDLLDNLREPVPGTLTKRYRKALSLLEAL